MKFNELLKNINVKSAYRRIVPLEQGLLFPMFSIENDNLVANFITHKSTVKPDGLQAYHPEFCLSFICRGSRLIRFEALRYNSGYKAEDFETFEMVLKGDDSEKEAKKAKIDKLVALGDALLEKWENEKIADFSEYNALLTEVLTAKQNEVFSKFLQVK